MIQIGIDPKSTTYLANNLIILLRTKQPRNCDKCSHNDQNKYCYKEYNLPCQIAPAGTKQPQDCDKCSHNDSNGYCSKEYNLPCQITPAQI